MRIKQTPDLPQGPRLALVLTEEYVSNSVLFRPSPPLSHCAQIHPLSPAPHFPILTVEHASDSVAPRNCPDSVPPQPVPHLVQPFLTAEHASDSVDPRHCPDRTSQIVRRPSLERDSSSPGRWRAPLSTTTSLLEGGPADEKGREHP